MPETFTPKTWADGSAGGTPITAAELNRLEAGVESMDDRVTALEAVGAVPADGSVTNTKVAADAAINADKLTDGVTNKMFTAAERTKLTGVAAAATANSTDAQLRDRSTHTGTQAISTITGLQTVLDAKADAAVAINPQTGASYTLVLADAGKVVHRSNASANTTTVPPNSSVAFPTGTVIGVYQAGAGASSVVAGSGVTIRSRGGLLASAGQYAELSLRKIAGDEWVLAGDVA